MVGIDPYVWSAATAVETLEASTEVSLGFSTEIVIVSEIAGFLALE